LRTFTLSALWDSVRTGRTVPRTCECGEKVDLETEFPSGDDAFV